LALITSAQGGHQNRQPWTSPTGTKLSINYGFFDSRYPDSVIRNQHAGLDIRAGAGDAVYAPVTGWIVTNETRDQAVGNSRIVLRDHRTGEEHVLGHISSTLAVCARIPCRLIAQGERVGRVREWLVRRPNGTYRDNAHLHWGVHRTSVAAGSTGSGWNWGQAPLGATRSQALTKGWVDMDQHIGSLRR